MSRVVALLVALPFLAGGVTAAVSADRGEVLFSFRDPAIVESSGLVARDGLVSTVNDSGDAGRVFSVDASGLTIGVTTFADAPVDVEALAPAGPGEVWVGDIGDNTASRASVSVSRVPVGRGPRSGDFPTSALVYAGGARDAETLLADPRTGRLYVVSKEIFGGTVYAAPRVLREDRPNRLEPVADAIPIATDGAFWPDGRHLVVRGYGRAVVYAWPSMRAVADLDLPDQDQGEGIAVTEDGRVLVSTEGQFTDVLQVPLPRAVRQVLEPPAAGGPEAPAEEPAAASPVDRDPQDVAGLPVWLLLGGGACLVAVALAGVVGWVVRRR